MKRRLAFLSGGPRISTKAIAEATGSRQHVLGTIAGFRENGWDVQSYIVGDKVPEKWISAGQEETMERSFIMRLAADFIRIGLAIFHGSKALKELDKPDWVYERYGALQLFGFVFQKRGTPWILETNSLMFEELTGDRKSVALAFLVRWAEKFAYEQCDLLVVISEGLKSAIVQKLGISSDKIVVLPNAADTEMFDPERVEPRRLFPERTFVIGFQGSMYKWAGLANLITAVASLRASGHDVAAVLLGGGQERQNLEKYARDAGVAEFIKFPGLVGREQVPEYIAGYDLCYSGQINLQNNSMYLSPLKLYDYMSMGKPVIASRFADAVTLTGDGKLGFLFAPEDVDDLIATAARAYRERDRLLAMGKTAREHILNHHSWTSRIRDFIVVAESKLQAQVRRRKPPRRIGVQK